MVDGGGAPVDRVIGALKKRLAQVRPMRLIAIAGVLFLAAVAASAFLFFYDFTPAPPSGEVDAAEGSGGDTLAGGLASSDFSGIPDALQNFLYGTDSQRWNTSGTPLPDGWLIRYGHDALDPSIHHRSAATPPPDALPATYGHHWPTRFTPTLWDIYSHERPADWDEASMGPFENGIDPTSWDNSGDGIPDGWLLHYGLDPLAGNVSDDRLAGPEGLTIAQAFEHNTDPTRLDTDRDGIPDREEIDGPRNPLTGERFAPTDPSRASTARTGVCDGYLVKYGLDPSDSGNSYRDLARSGATTVQKFDWSKERFGDAACTQGRGLDPTKVSTLDGPIPDGWLIRYGLDPLDEAVADRVTQSSTDHADGPWAKRTEKPAGTTLELPHVELTVLDEYLHGRPTDWDETVSGPWWGGTDPSKVDTDGDGLPDTVEMRGYYVGVSLDVGPGEDEGLQPRQYYTASSEPTRADTSGDGLIDYEEVVEHGTDPTKRDTDLDGIPDAKEVLLDLGLDPTRADSAGDHLLDGVRLAMLETRSTAYREDPLYEYPGKPGLARRITDWACGSTTVQCTTSAVADLFAPEGDMDGDGVPNIVDADMDGDGLLNGLEVDPTLYDKVSVNRPVLPRAETDPLNPDTDGDGLRDDWEVKHGVRVPVVIGGQATQGYSLDPSRWDSDGDGTSDADEDHDDDGVCWPAYPEAGKLDITCDGFHNLAEQEYEAQGADPNDPTSDGDGLKDGWKVFWGITYPGLHAAEDESLGVHTPASVPNDERRPLLGKDQSGDDVVVLVEGTYTRFSLDNELGGDHEVLVDADGSDPKYPVESDGGHDIYRIDGTERFTLQDARAQGTNPYMAATGTAPDGIPDWWKWLHRFPPENPPEEAQCVSMEASGPLDPLDPDAWKEDIDEDGLNLLQEYLVGTNPWCYSTTLITGIPDSEFERFLLSGGDPLDLPTNLAVLDDQGMDSDRDGVPDFQEILDGTDRHDPDTDGDGLLDGGNVQLNPGNDADKPWIKLYLDLGIAYKMASDGGFIFQGEEGQARPLHPLNPDDTGTGIPAGWLVAHGGLLDSSELLNDYAFGKPEWWDHSEHGPWWGGLRPSQTVPKCAASGDLDCDGLQDADEDPMPGGNRLNEWRELPWADYPDLGDGAPALEAPDDGAHPTEAGLDPLQQRLLAQSYLNPREVGEASHRSFIHHPRPDSLPDRLLPCIIYGGIEDPDGNAVASIKKGSLAYAVGRIHDCSPQKNGFHGVTVLFEGSGKTFGAAFTEADGTFRIPVNIVGQQSVTIPDSAGTLVLRGQTSGTVNWTSDASDILPGTGRPFTLRTYAAPAEDPRPALRSIGETITSTVKADSVISFRNFPSQAVTGAADLTINYQIADSGGSPLEDPVEFHWDGQNLPPVTSQPAKDGRGQVRMPVPHTLAGQQSLVANSLPDSDDVTAAFSEQKVTLRNPIKIGLDPVVSPIDAGTALPVKGNVVLDNQGKTGISVEMDLVRDGEVVASDEAITGSGGSFEGRLEIPTEQAKGEHLLIVTAKQTTKTIERKSAATLEVRSLPTFTEVSTDGIAQGEPVPVSGRLLEPDASPVAGASVIVRLDDLRQTVTTGDDGRFALEITQDLPVRPVLQELEFPGDGLHAPAMHRSERAVLASTTLELEAGVLPRGADLDLPVHLHDSAGSPIEGAPIHVTWGGGPSVQVLTDATGQGVFHRQGSPSDPIGTVTVRAEYRGSADGGHMPAVHAVGWSVQTIAEIVLPSGPLEAGGPIPRAVLRDAGTGEPLPRSPVTHGMILDPASGGQAPSMEETETDGDGRFTVLPAFNKTHPPQRIGLVAAFDGDDAYGPATATSNVTVQGPVDMDVVVPKHFVTGRAVLVNVDVLGQDGSRIDEGVVHVALDGETVGSAPVEEGRARVQVTIPHDAPAGPIVLRFSFQDATFFAPSTVERPTHLLRGVSLSVQVDAGLPGKTTVVRVVATSGTQPVPFAPIHLDVEGIEGGLLGETDEDGVATFTLEQPVDARLVAARFTGMDTLNPTHATATLVPATPTTPLERGTGVLMWSLFWAAVAVTVLAPFVYRLRMSPLQPLFWQARRTVAGRGPHEEQILRAYHQLEEAAIGRGLLSEPAQTARLLEAALVPHLPTAAHPGLDRLVGLFEVARYGTQPMGPQHQRQGLAALDSIVRALRAEAGFAWPRFSSRRRVAA